MSAKAQAARLKQMLRVRKRRGVREWKDQQKKIENMAIMIQKHVRRKLAEIHHEERDYAIEFIQAPVRGYLVRQDMHRKKYAANRLQRVYRGAQVRLDLRRAARALTLIQRIMRGKLTRNRLRLQKLRHERVVHTFIAIERLLARSTLLWDMGKWQQYRDSETNAVWYYNTEENDTRWKAPECFDGLFVCGFDDCQTKMCKKSFQTQQELNEHRKTHNWECDSCWWKNGWADWPKCSMCANICTKHPINLNVELEKRRAYRARKELLAKQKERLDEKRRKERARRLESKRRADAQKRERQETRLMQQEDQIFLSRHELPQEEEPVSKTQRNKIKLDDDEAAFDISLANASATEIVEAVFKFAAEYHHVYPLKNGMSVHRYPDGSMYVGEMLDSAPHGQGEMVGVNGDRYKGEWENGKRHGVGELEMASGLRYDGPWKFGARHGWGKLVLPNGDIYEGEWDHGLLCGRGTMISADNDGDVYEGNWQSSKFHGVGTYRKSNGDVYTGHFNMGVVRVFRHRRDIVVRVCALLVVLAAHSFVGSDLISRERV